MILLDTTILVYAVGDLHPLREPCRRILTAQLEEVVEAGTTVQVIQEFVYVRARRLSRLDAVTLARQYLAAFDVIDISPADLELGLELFTSHAALGSFDAVLAATALNRRCEALVSADLGFREVPGLQWIDPGGPDLDSLLLRA